MEAVATICDLALDPDTLDILVADGDIALIYDADVVAQRLRLRLSRVLGEWFLDATSGVDYLGEVFAKQTASEAAIRDAILSTPYVRGLDTFEASVDQATRRLSVEFSADTEFGTVSVLVEAP